MHQSNFPSSRLFVFVFFKMITNILKRFLYVQIAYFFGEELWRCVIFVYGDHGSFYMYFLYYYTPGKETKPLKHWWGSFTVKDSDPRNINDGEQNKAIKKTDVKNQN